MFKLTLLNINCRQRYRFLYFEETESDDTGCSNWDMQSW